MLASSGVWTILPLHLGDRWLQLCRINNRMRFSWVIFWVKRLSNPSSLGAFADQRLRCAATYWHSVHLIALIRKGLPKLTDRNGIYFLSIAAKVISLKDVKWMLQWNTVRRREATQLPVSEARPRWALTLAQHSGATASNPPCYCSPLPKQYPGEYGGLRGSISQRGWRAAAALHVSLEFISSPFVAAPRSVTFSSRGRERDQITIGNPLFWQMKHKDPLSSLLF